MLRFSKSSKELLSIAKLRCKKISTKHKVKNFRRTFLGTIITDQMSIYEFDCEKDD